MRGETSRTSLIAWRRRERRTRWCEEGNDGTGRQLLGSGSSEVRERS
jgi:hypothetical protein